MLCIQLDEFDQGVFLGTSKSSQRKNVEVENIQLDAKYSCDNGNGSMSTNENVSNIIKKRVLGHLDELDQDVTIGNTITSER